MNLFNVILHLTCFPIRKASSELNAINSLNSDQLQKHHQSKKGKILNHHLKHNSFYKSLAKAGTFASWNDVPIMTKQDLQIPLTDRLSNGFNQKNVYINKTSGSSGDPFVFAKDKFCHAMTWSVFDEWYGWHDIYNKKQARFYGIPLDKKGYYKERIKDFVTKRYRFNVFDLSEQALDDWVRKFSKGNFVFITGYTSVIVAFAKHLSKKNITLSDICPTLKACLPTSEMCSEDDKNIMSKAFNIPIINEYGSAEFGLIALEKDQFWVLNNLNLYVEILDYDNNVLPHGEEGRIIITDLYNKAHPFIRYDIGDIGSIDTIGNNIKVLKSLSGRKEDYVKLPSGKTAPGLSLYYVTKSVMDDTGFIKEIKVLQLTLNKFKIEYVANSALNEAQKNKVLKAFMTYLEPGIEVLFTRQTQLQRTERGKLKQFTSLL